jgi:hypothetical protein
MADQPTGSAVPDRAAALRFRGEVLDSFGRLEQGLCQVLIRAAASPWYDFLKPAFPHSLGLRLERLRRLIELPGPFAARAQAVAARLERVAAHEEARHFMAHGALEAVTGADDRPLWVFAFTQTRGGRPREARLELTPEAADALAGRIGRDCDALADELARLIAEPPGAPPL